LHFSGLPTFYITGADDTEASVSLGGATAIMLRNPDAKLGFVEFHGNGLGALERAIAAKEAQMASLGASVLAAEAKRGTGETATAASIRHGAESALLTATVSAVQEGLIRALKFAAEWVGANPQDVEVALNTDFLSAKLDWPYCGISGGRHDTRSAATKPCGRRYNSAD
jgi:hypothetical protein